MDSALATLLAPYAQALQGQPTPINPLGGLFSLMSQTPTPNPLPGQGAGGSYSSNGNRWEQLAAQMAQRKEGWGPQQFRALDQIISAESGWNPNAVNPSSGAYGIPQILPSAHPDSLGLNPQEQIQWLLKYVAGRYGTPQDALAFRQQHGWY